MLQQLLCVSKELHKIHKLNTSFHKLSEFLNEKIVVLEINYHNGQISTNTVYETKILQYQYNVTEEVKIILLISSISIFCKRSKFVTLTFIYL